MVFSVILALHWCMCLCLCLKPSQCALCNVLLLLLLLLFGRVAYLEEQPEVGQHQCAVDSLVQGCDVGDCAIRVQHFFAMEGDKGVWYGAHHSETRGRLAQQKRMTCCLLVACWFVDCGLCQYTFVCRMSHAAKFPFFADNGTFFVLIGYFCA